MIGADSLWDLIQHFNGQKPIPAAQAGEIEAPVILGDLCDIKGQERDKRALEIAVAGRHHLFLVGTPGYGKSMLAKRSLGLLPPLTPAQALKTSMIKSIFGELSNGGGFTSATVSTAASYHLGRGNYRRRAGCKTRRNQPCP